jgi:cobalt-zinc-cadmium efflux system protein
MELRRAHPHDHLSQRRALWISLASNGVFLAAELTGGLVFGSLALIADSAHMLSDVIALTIALTAQSLMLRPASSRHTFGLQRAEVVGAQVNGIILVAVAGWIAYEAVGRWSHPQTIRGAGVFAVAALGLLVNVASAVLLARARGDNLNMRGAFLHMAADAAGSVAALVAGISALVWQAYWVDPAASLVIAVLILWSSWRLLRDTTHVLMEGAPANIDLRAVESALAAHDGVREVHHVHLWTIASDVPSLSAHVVLDRDLSLHEAQLERERLKQILSARFGIGHATLELECHPCEVLSEPAATGVAHSEKNA